MNIPDNPGNQPHESMVDFAVRLIDEGQGEDAVPILEAEVAAGDPRAMFELGCYLDTIEERHVELLQKSLDLGYGPAGEPLGAYYMTYGETDTAMQVYRRGMELGDGDCAFFYGSILDDYDFEDDSEGDAEAAFQTGVQLGNFDSAGKLGGLREAREDYHGALEAYHEGIRLGSPTSAEFAAAVLKEHGDVIALQDLLVGEIKAGSGNAAYSLAVIQEELGELDGAQELLLRGVRLGNPHAAMKIGMQFFEEENYPAAVGPLKIAALSGIDEAVEPYGESLFEVKDMRSLEELVASKDYRFRSVGHAWLGYYFDEAEETDTAIHHYTQAAKLGNHSVLTNLGIIYLNQENTEMALKTFRYGMELGNPDCVLHYAELQRQAGNERAALKALEQYGDQVDPQYWLMSGVLHLQLEDTNSAIEAFQEGVALGHAESAMSLGLIYVEQGDMAAAQEAVDTANRLGLDSLDLNTLVAQLEDVDD